MQQYWWVYLIAAIILTTAYQIFKKYRQTVVFLATALGVAAAILQFQAQTDQLHAQASQNHAAVRHSRVQVAFEYMRRWNDESFRATLPEATAALEGVAGKSPEQIHEYLGKNDAQRKALMAVFNLFEDIGLAVRTGYADDEALCQFFSEPVKRYFSTLRPWLDFYRAKTGRHGAYEHYQWLNESWSKGCPAETIKK
jgi:hypothetical protein